MKFSVYKAIKLYSETKKLNQDFSANDEFTVEYQKVLPSIIPSLNLDIVLNFYEKGLKEPSMCLQMKLNM